MPDDIECMKVLGGRPAGDKIVLVLQNLDGEEFEATVAVEKLTRVGDPLPDEQAA